MAGSYRLFTDMARRSGSFFVHRTVMGISGPVRRMAVAPRHLGRISKVRTFWKASSMVYRHTTISFRKGFINIKKYSVNSNWRLFFNFLGGSLLGRFGDHGDSGFIGSDNLRPCKAVPSLYVELRQSVLGVRAPEDTQMKGFRVKIGPDLGMLVPDVAQSAGGYRGSTAPQRLWGVGFAVGGPSW